MYEQRNKKGDFLTGILYKHNATGMNHNTVAGKNIRLTSSTK